MKIGVNLFESAVLDGDPGCAALLACRPDLVVCHMSPGETAGAEGTQKAARLRDLFLSEDVDLIADFEFQNVAGSAVDADGIDWCRAPDGGHRLHPNPAFLKTLADGGRLIGAIYDEFDYAVSTGNLSLWLGSKRTFGAPAFPEPETGDVYAHGEAVAQAIAQDVRRVKAAGVPVFAGEHVFPVFYHLFARCGMVPNYKAQKESCSNLQYAVAAGAALQYHLPLWSCIDMWYRQKFPGHSADELYRNLLFAWHAGVSLAYVESAPALTDGGALNANGKALQRFISGYKGRSPGYTAADYRPEIGIIRYDDGWWGQNAFWAHGLFGSRRLPHDRRSTEWIRAVHLVTRGESGRFSFNLNRIDHTLAKRHRAFSTMNALAVFDDRVRAQTLSSLKLVFLCGRYISRETMADVGRLVRENGLVCVCPRRFAPERFSLLADTAYTEIADGKGSWIVTDELLSGRLRRRLSPYFGRKNEIRLPFGDREVRFSLSDNGDLELIEQIGQDEK
ncbi:MAG: hypothetical protein IJK40_07440 [Clostridia bacterium]|nr:hypothetical protein [Clostridia bacterium]